MTKSPLIIIGLLGLTAFVAMFWSFPGYQTLQKTKADIEVKNREVANRDAYFASLRAQDKKVEEYKEKIERVDAALPADPELPSLFDLLQDAAATSGLLLKEIKSSVSAPSELSRFSKIQVDLMTEGSYEGMKQFVHNVQNSWRIIQIDSLAIQTQEDDSTIFEMSLSSFSY